MHMKGKLDEFRETALPVLIEVKRPGDAPKACLAISIFLAGWLGRL